MIHYISNTFIHTHDQKQEEKIKRLQHNAQPSDLESMLVQKIKELHQHFGQEINIVKNNVTHTYNCLKVRGGELKKSHILDFSVKIDLYNTVVSKEINCATIRERMLQCTTKKDTDELLYLLSTVLSINPTIAIVISTASFSFRFDVYFLQLLVSLNQRIILCSFHVQLF